MQRSFAYLPALLRYLRSQLLQTTRRRNTTRKLPGPGPALLSSLPTGLLGLNSTAVTRLLYEHAALGMWTSAKVK